MRRVKKFAGIVLVALALLALLGVREMRVALNPQPEPPGIVLNPQPEPPG